MWWAKILLRKQFNSFDLLFASPPPAVEVKNNKNNVNNFISVVIVVSNPRPRPTRAQPAIVLICHDLKYFSP